MLMILARYFSAVLLFGLITIVPVASPASGLDNYYLARFDALYGKQAQKVLSMQSPDPAVPERCLTPLMHGLKRDWKQLQASTQMTLAKYVGKPALLGESVVKSNGGHFFIHFATVAPDAPPLDDANGNGIPDWVETVADVFEAVYAREVVAFGYTAPPTSSGLPYDVYLQDLAGQGMYGFTQSVDPTNAGAGVNAFTSFIVIDKDFATFNDGYSPLQDLKITAAHEFHHAIQYGYNFFFDIWYAEATSTWMEGEVYGSVSQLYSYLRAFANNTNLALDTPVSVTTGGGYGRWLFNRAINEAFTPTTTIKSIWERLAIKNPGPPDASGNVPDILMLPVLDEVLTGQGSSLGATFLGYAKKFYLRDWASHTGDIGLIPQLSVPNTITYTVNGTFPLPAVSLPAYSFQYYKLVPTATTAAPLTISYTKPTSSYTLNAFQKPVGGTATEYPFVGAFSGTISIPSVAAGAEIYVLVCNNGTGSPTTPPFAKAVPTPGDAVNPNTGAPLLVSSTPPPPPANSGGGGGGCFIATAAYGSYLHPKVQLLRDFRDRFLLTNAPGRAFVTTYYRWSPPLADFIARHDVARTFCRLLLAPLIFAVEHGQAALLFLLAALSLPLGRRRYHRSRPTRG